MPNSQSRSWHTVSTLYNVTVKLRSSKNGNVPAIHPRVIVQSSAFGLPTCHSQSFKLTLQPFCFQIDWTFLKHLCQHTLHFFLRFSRCTLTILPSATSVSPSFFIWCHIFFHLTCPSTFWFPFSVNFKPHSLHLSPPTPLSRSNTRYPPFQTHQFSNEPLSVFRSLCLLKPHASCILFTPSFPFSLSCLYSLSLGCSLLVNALTMVKQSPTLHPSFAWIKHL